MAQTQDASPICRGKNLSWETILLFYNNMPRKAMPKAQFHAFTESRINGWTQTHSQIARQLAFYYEKDGICYPRFTEEISFTDLFSYMQSWAAKYFIPNPYAPSLKDYQPTCIYTAVVNAVKSGECDFDKILDGIFGITLSSHDKVKVYLSNYTDLLFEGKNVSINNRVSQHITAVAPTNECAIDEKKYYEYFNFSPTKSQSYTHGEPRQIIFFGAPGTGKSFRVEQITEQYGDDVIRTTFHPDSDYSTFVGCYKPTMQELQSVLAEQPILDYDSLVDKFKEYLSVPNVNITKACTLFGYQYHDSIVRMQEQGRRIMDLVNDAYKSNTSYDSVVRGGMSCYEENRLAPVSKAEIAYSFVPQAFTQAYTKAWLNPDKPIFLVIEELNRGNCAQIFGDIFQLLDRNENNESAYSIIPDHDLQQHLTEVFKNADNIPADIKEAKAMRLPSNLYIWATMNTSDQSLFPIDSAFKRRWIWKYIPIANAEKGYKIQVGDHQYDWWTFVDKVNNEIEGATKSEDKKLGYFFAKADNGIIAADTFVSKVVFYLWNDVFKDSFDKTIFKNDLTFHKFFEPNGEPKLEVIDQFMHDLELKAEGEE